jgi:hypothetical protein
MDKLLADKLKRLGVKFGKGEVLPPPEHNENFSVAKIIPGAEINTIFGRCYRVSKQLKRDHIHGISNLIIDGEIGLVADWSRTLSLRDQTADQLVFLDTETSGLSGGTGTFAFLVGVSRQTNDGLEFTQFLLTDPSEEQAMLTALSEYMTGATAVVTYNGKSFDIPLLNNRYILHGLTSPFIDLAHIDLLSLSRKIWRRKLASRRLSNVETEILRVERTIDEVPGYLVPQVYFDYLKSGDARPLAGVLYHNEMDVLSLSTLLQHFMHAFSQSALETEDKPDDIYPIVNMMLDLGKNENAISLFNKVFQPDLCSLQDDWDTIEKMALFFKRQSAWEPAVRIWEAAAELGLEFGWFELSKYYEHRARNYPEALHFAELIQNHVTESNLPAFTKNVRLEELQKRISRIQQKIYSKK